MKTAPKESPILFSTPMVQAILAGRKTQTRRIIKPQPVIMSDDYHFNYKDNPYLPPEEFVEQFCPYAKKAGDLLWVRETCSYFKQIGGSLQHEKTKYKADACWDGNDSIKWKPSIHMPKSAARIWLQVKDVRVERLQDISGYEIKAEGVRIPVNGIGSGRVVLEIGSKNKAIDWLPMMPKRKPTQKQLMFAHWAELWCSVNGRKSWDDNPWVWAVEFERIDRPN